jgi:hypothetical protein
LTPNGRLEKRTRPTSNARAARADERAADLAPVVKELQAAGITSLNDFGAALDARGVGRWHAIQDARAGAVAGMKPDGRVGWRPA